MKFVVDENVSFGLVEALRKNREEVLAIVEDNRGVSDTAVFNLAQKDNVLGVHEVSKARGQIRTCCPNL